MKNILYSIIILYLLFDLYCCNDNKTINDNENQILVKIGDEIITVNDFRKNYELGFGNLKKGKNSKQMYLNHMIHEKLLSIEGYNKHFDETKKVKNLVRYLKNEIIIEKYIQEKIKDKIEVTQKEIIDYINKSKVQFKFRYWVESNRQKAINIAADMKIRGYAKVLNDIINKNPEFSVDPNNFETDYLNHEQVSSAVLDAIKNLPYGEVSDPVELNSKFYIFQVLDIRRNSITENEYIARGPSVREVILYKKFESALVDFGTKLMDNKNIKIKHFAFNLLKNALIEWSNIKSGNRKEFSAYLAEPNYKNPALKKLSENSKTTFLEYNEGVISIEQFIQNFNPNKFTKVFESEDHYINYLHTIVSRSIRDIFLLKEAKKENIEFNEEIRHELKLWKDKWVYAEVLNKKVKEFSNSKDSKSMIKEYLIKEIKNLKKKYKIMVNQTVLDTLKVIDFKKSKWASMQLLKFGSNKPAYPVVDPRLEILKTD